MKYNSHLTGQSGASSNLIVQPTQCLGERTLRASKVQGRMAPEGLAKVTGLPCRCTRRRGRSQRQPPAGRGSGSGAPGTPKAGAGGDKGRSPSSPRRLRAHAAPPKFICTRHRRSSFFDGFHDFAPREVALSKQSITQQKSSRLSWRLAIAKNPLEI